ncbi:MAG: GNAT family N-acetyltransferase [Terrimonas sp.]|nr:GNAT family N-acetyltransferase [Terrimonas sp.]
MCIRSCTALSRNCYIHKKIIVNPTNIRFAEKKDIPELTALVNRAFRGELSRKGWTTEADFLEGDTRIDKNGLEEMLGKAGSTLLIYSENGQDAGCVYVQVQPGQLYLGMLTVDPLAQARGIGRKLMLAAEDHARSHGCQSIHMNVISLRTELIDWYLRQGYFRTGETKPFPNQPAYGIPNQPLEFIILRKDL